MVCFVEKREGEEKRMKKRQFQMEFAIEDGRYIR